MGENIFAVKGFSAWERTTKVDGIAYSNLHVLLKNGDRVTISDDGLVVIYSGKQTATINLRQSYLLAQLCNGVEIETTSSFYRMDGVRISSPKGNGKKKYRLFSIPKPKRKKKKKKRKKK